MPSPENPYKGLYAPLPDVQAYLDRLNYTGDTAPTLETLAALMWAHLTNIPFECEEISRLGIQASLNIEDLYDKMVTRRRGGYCFEQNGLYIKLLDALGFDVYSVGVRICRGRSWKSPISHRGIIATIDGRRYYTDVGFGGPCPVTPIALEEEGWQQSGSRWYKAGKTGPRYQIYIRSDEDPEDLLFDFSEEPWDEVDFIGPNTLMSGFPTSGFRANPRVSLLTETGHRSLTPEVYKEKDGDEMIEIPIDSPETFRRIMEEKFGLY